MITCCRTLLHQQAARHVCLCEPCSTVSCAVMPQLPGCCLPSLLLRMCPPPVHVARGCVLTPQAGVGDVQHGPCCRYGCTKSCRCLIASTGLHSSTCTVCVVAGWGPRCNRLILGTVCLLEGPCDVLNIPVSDQYCDAADIHGYGGVLRIQSGSPHIGPEGLLSLVRP